jgi:hypothetical protein
MMKEQGISEFVIMPFWPLRIGYCEGVWWDRIALALEFCAKEAMRAWIYDDYSWPSGACGGKLLRDMPWTRNVVMGYLTLEVAPGATASAEIEGTLLAASALTPDHKIADITHEAGCTGQAGRQTTATVEWRNRFGGPVRVYLFVRNVCDELLNFGVGAPWSWAQRGYLNTLDPDAVEAFVESTYEEYARRFASSFGREIVGFFTDEPSLSYYGTAYGTTSLPYTDGFFDLFRERRGYDLRPRLPELLQDTGDFRKTRVDYWSLITERFTTSYHRTLRRWCDRHRLLLTGHPVWEEAIGWNIVHSGDMHEGNKWYHAPGFDLLQTNTGFDHGFQEKSIHIGIAPGALNVTAKIEESTARHSGAPRMMCEAYGVGSWALTLEDQKKATDWITGMGASLIVDCLLPHATHGFIRNRVCGKNFHTPWWHHYHIFNAYAARMCAIAAECPLKAGIGVLFPMRNAHALFNEALRPNRFLLCEENRRTPWGIMQESVYFVSEELLRLHWDYDLVFDSVLDACRVEAGKLVAPHSAYSVLVLPGVSCLTAAQLDKITEFACSGGTLVLVAAVPEFSSDGSAGVKEGMAKLLQMGNVISLPHAAVLDRDSAALDRALLGVLPKEVSIEGPGARDIMKVHRVHGTHDVVLLANQSPERVRVGIALSLGGPVEVWDAFTARRFAAALGQDPVRRLDYEFAPHESVFLVAGPVTEPDSRLPPIHSKSWRMQRVTDRQTLGGAWEFSPEGGNMFLPDWMVRVDKDDTGESLGWHRDEADEGWLPSQWSEAEVHLDPDVNRCYWLKTRITLSGACPDMGLVVDLRSECEGVFVNGARAAGPVPCTLWDPENGRYDIGAHMTAGENTLVVKNRIPKWHGSSKTVYIVDYRDIDPPVLVGQFEHDEGTSLVPALDAKRRVLSGSWHTQGYRNFAGTGIYQRTVRVDALAEGERVWLDLGRVGDVAEVRLNGRHVETLLVPPYEAELTGHIVAGENQLEIRVTNNFGNLMFGMWTGRIRHFTSAGLLTEPTLIRTGN